MEIEVKRVDDNNFVVNVREGNSQTEHRVSFDDEYYKTLISSSGTRAGEISKEKLIEKSFEFLLRREPKESILSSFDMRVIKRYFPEYEREIKKEL